MSRERAWDLVISTGANRLRHSVEPDQEFLLGSGPDANIRLEGPGVGPQHLHVEWVPEGLTVVGLDPAYASFLNGKELPPAEAITAGPGALIEVGGFQIHVQPGAVLDAATASRPSFKIVIEGKKKDRQQYVLLAGQSMVIGRGADAQIHVEDPDVSRRHLKITWRVQGVELMDLGSTHGTEIDRRAIEPNVPVLLRPEEWKKVDVGGHTLEVFRMLVNAASASERTRPITGEQKRVTAFRSKMAVGHDFYNDLSHPATEAFLRSALGPDQDDPQTEAFIRSAVGVAQPADGASASAPAVLQDRAAPTMILAEDGSRAYMIQGELGRGAQGIVYSALVHGEQSFEGFQEPVESAVLKIGKDEEALLKEQLIYGAPDRGMVKLLDAGRHHDKPFIVLERLQPPPFFKFGAGPAGRPTDAATAINIFMNLLDVLARLHTRKGMPVVLCDIKPENIMLRMTAPGGEVSDGEYLRHLADGTYQPVFMDMGCAHHHDVLRRSKGRLRDFVGTPVYLPPEAIPTPKGDEPGKFSPGIYSDKTDVYALSLTLYQMLTADRPYSHKGLYQRRGQAFLMELLGLKRDRVRPYDPKKLAKRFEGRTKEFEEILFAGLHPDPAKRPTARGLLDLARKAFKASEVPKKSAAEFRYDATPGLRLEGKLFRAIDPAKNIYLRGRG